MNKFRQFIAAVSFLVGYAAINLYVVYKIYLWINSRFPPNDIIFLCVFLCLFLLSLVVKYLPMGSSFSRIMQKIGSYWMGIAIYLLMFFVAVDMVNLFNKFTGIIPVSILNVINFYTGPAAVLMSFILIGYGRYNAKKIKLVSYEVKLKNAVLNNFKITLISDLHLGSVSNSEKKLERIVNIINKMNPDIVCIPGDIFNEDFSGIRNSGGAIAVLKNIKTAYGVYACLGNHDRGHTLNQMIDFLEKSNIKLLNDEHVIIDNRLALFGRQDSSTVERKDITNALNSVSTNFPVVIMDHKPGNIVEYSNSVGLVLSGHTHGGQLFPVTLFKNLMFKVGYGYYQKDENSPQLIVTSGISLFGPPIRIGTNNEIVSITLR